MSNLTRSYGSTVWQERPPDPPLAPRPPSSSEGWVDRAGIPVARIIPAAIGSLPIAGTMSGTVHSMASMGMSEPGDRPQVGKGKIGSGGKGLRRRMEGQRQRGGSPSISLEQGLLRSGEPLVPRQNPPIKTMVEEARPDVAPSPNSISSQQVQAEMGKGSGEQNMQSGFTGRPSFGKGGSIPANWQPHSEPQVRPVAPPAPLNLAPFPPVLAIMQMNLLNAMQEISKLDATISAMCLRRSQIHSQVVTEQLCMYECLSAHTMSGSLLMQGAPRAPAVPDVAQPSNPSRKKSPKQ